jgi:hypothetical protein
MKIFHSLSSEELVRLKCLRNQKSKKFKVGFFGASETMWYEFHAPGVEYTSYIDMLVKKLNFDVVYFGKGSYSEERVFHEIKKIKNIDLAIVFHANNGYVSIPKGNRDYKILTERNIKATANYIFNPKHSYLKDSNGVKLFGTKENLVNVLMAYKKYFYDGNWFQDRFLAMSMMIDNYLLNKKIKSFHLIRKNFYPSWFKFLSGPVDNKILDYIEKNHKVYNNEKNYADEQKKGIRHGNLIDAEGQQVLFDLLYPIIEKLITEYNQK